jgi:hypothetical protein
LKKKVLMDAAQILKDSASKKFLSSMKYFSGKWTLFHPPNYHPNHSQNPNYPFITTELFGPLLEFFLWSLKGCTPSHFDSNILKIRKKTMIVLKNA